MRLLPWLLCVFLAGPSSAFAQAMAVPGPANLSAYATKAEQTAAIAAAVGALAIPTPGAAVPMPEMVGGAAGVAATYLRSDAQIPRNSRAQTVLVGANGVFGGSWNSALASANPILVLTPILAGTAAVSCKLTATPTATTFAGLCRTEQSTLLTLNLVTASITVAPFANAANGMAVQVTAITPTQ